MLPAALPLWTAVTELEHGDWLASHGRADEAPPDVGRPRETFERLQATP